MTLFRRATLCLLLLFVLALLVQAQDEGTDASPDTLTYALVPIVVYGPPFTLTTETAPFAVSTLTRSDTDLNSNPSLALDRFIYAMPAFRIQASGWAVMHRCSRSSPSTICSARATTARSS